jgi:hypothetical protein
MATGVGNKFEREPGKGLYLNEKNNKNYTMIYKQP